MSRASGWRNEGTQDLSSRAYLLTRPAINQINSDQHPRPLNGYVIDPALKYRRSREGGSPAVILDSRLRENDGSRELKGRVNNIIQQPVNDGYCDRVCPDYRGPGFGRRTTRAGPERIGDIRWKNESVRRYPKLDIAL